MTQVTVLKGQTLRFSSNPFLGNWGDAIDFKSRGAVAMADGKILDHGEADIVVAKFPQADVRDYGSDLIMAGFVDAHVHYPQTAIIASWGKRLIDWLNGYTFPEEMKFNNDDYATDIAGRYLDLALAHGTTSVASYCTIHPQSVDAFFTQAEARQMRVVAGKTCMDRNAPDGLCDTAQSAYDDSKTLLDRWHKRGRAEYAITPRFSPTSTPDQLAAMGALWAEHPSCLMQTHLSEQTDEITWVRELFPNARDYLDTYEQFGLLGAKGLYGHAIHLEPREIDRLKELNAGIVHCPTSNTFIGSGLFDLMGLAGTGHRVGLATDTGGGSSFSMLRTMAAAYEIGQLHGTAIHPSQLLWLATVGSARSLHMDDKIGNIDKDLEADLVVIDLASTRAIEQRYAAAKDEWSAIFPTIMMGDDRAIRSVWVNGSEVS